MKSVDLSKATVVRFECTKCTRATEVPLNEFLDSKNIQNIGKCREHCADSTIAMYKENVASLARTLQWLAEISQYNLKNPGSYFGLPIRIKLLGEEMAGVQ